MTRTDWLAGVKHAWHLDRAGNLGFAAYEAALAAVTVIVGAPLWVTLVILVIALVPTVTSTVRRARAARDSREFYEWLLSVEHPSPEDVDVE